MLSFVIEHPEVIGSSFCIKLPKGVGKKAIELKFARVIFLMALLQGATIKDA